MTLGLYSEGICWMADEIEINQVITVLLGKRYYNRTQAWVAIRKPLPFWGEERKKNPKKKIKCKNKYIRVIQAERNFK